MQPTYIPWAGYFNLVGQADTFVFLDDVQFERRSWQSRNRILLNGQEHLLTVPVAKASRATLLKDIQLSDDEDWMDRHLRVLNDAYRKAAHGSEMLQILERVFSARTYSRLTELTEQIIQSVADALNIDTAFRRASSLGCGGKRTDHLIEICRKLGCDSYLSPAGSRDYLKHDDFVGKTAISLAFQDYRPAPYPQYRSDGFVSHLSILDVIANLGLPSTSRYVAGST